MGREQHKSRRQSALPLVWTVWRLPLPLRQLTSTDRRGSSDRQLCRTLDTWTRQFRLLVKRRAQAKRDTTVCPRPRPYVHLHAKEQYWPADVAEHLAHTTQRLNYTELAGNARGLMNLDELNGEDHTGNGKNVYLQSMDDVESNPVWLGGRRNIPNSFGTNTAGIEEASTPARQPARSPIENCVADEQKSHRLLQPQSLMHLAGPTHLRS